MFSWISKLLAIALVAGLLIFGAAVQSADACWGWGWGGHGHYGGYYGHGGYHGHAAYYHGHHGPHGYVTYPRYYSGYGYVGEYPRYHRHGYSIWNRGYGRPIPW